MTNPASPRLPLRHFGLRPLSPRDDQDAHRAATPLELLFDLVSVIAIASAAAGLHHAIASGHVGEGVVSFLASFFAIWWAWMNFTWYASAYDNDDSLHRLLTMVMMAGSLIMAAGIHRFFESTRIDMIVMGFVVMRIAMVLFWLRAAYHDSDRRKTAYRYAGGIALVQVFWVGLMLAQPMPPVFLFSLYALGAVLELSVPVYAESHVTTPWHRHHLIERYGLLNLIVLGETLLAAAMALQHADVGHLDLDLLSVAGAALVIVFSLWWAYFSKEEHIARKRLSLALVWGYGHLVIYMAGAAVGAGIAAMVDVLTGESGTSYRIALYAISVPVSLYLMGLWFVRDRLVLSHAGRHILLGVSVLILVATLFMPLWGIALTLAIGVGARNIQACGAKTGGEGHAV